MCDDVTEKENERYLSQARLGRREFGIGAGAAVASLVAGCEPATTRPAPATAGDAPRAPAPDPVPSATAPESASASDLIRRSVIIATPDGNAEALLFAPKTGPRPGVLMWPDVAGLRPAYEQMATRLAKGGYAVLALNPYYRSTKLPLFQKFDEWRTEEGKAKVAPMREALTPEAIARDGAAFVAWLDQQPEVDTAKKVAAMGYCMSGSFAFRAAAAVPARMGAIASFHGGGLVTGDATSPHQLMAKMKAAVLICIAQNDDEREPKAKAELRTSADAAKITAEIEVYPAQHGWCTLDSPVYDQAQAERAWARMLALYRAHL